MQPYQRLLFSGFPRDIGVPSRFSVFTADHFDRVVSKANDSSNVYCSISRLPVTGPETDKVFFDLDAKAESMESMHESEQFRRMREDSDVAEQVLGDVVDDMQTLATASIEDDIPIIGIFSGKGVHIHQMYQTTKNPGNELLSIGNKYTQELDMETVDVRVFEPLRITKIPNTQRFHDGKKTGVWTVPLTANEMAEIGVSELLEWSKAPRHPPMDPALLNESQRPEMEVYDDYLRRTGGNVPERPMGEIGDIPGDVEDIVEQFIDLPCVRERVLTRDPDHEIRLNFVVMLFNYGFSKSEVHDIIRKLSWANYDPEMTKKQIQSIWRNKYADMSCRGLMERGFCVRSENPQDCPTYGWSGGTQLY